MAIQEKSIPHIRRAGFRLSSVIGCISMMLVCCAFSLAQTLTVLHQFNGGPGDGYNPFAPVVVSQNGVLYGTTFYGGNSQDCVVGCGEVYQVAPPAEPGGAWNYSAIYEFTGGSDGCCVYSSLTLDSKGRLYGANNSLFQLAPSTSAFWKYNDLYDFTNSIYPSTPLVIDSAGALYGVSTNGGLQNCGGGAYFCGVVLQFVPAQNGPWTENVLYQFTGGGDGAFPASIVLDSTTGTIYGIASGGGIMSPSCTYSYGCGTVFKLAPTPGGTWKYTVLYSFTGVHDSSPYAGLVRDSSGNLYGLAIRGQYGTEVFELTPRKNGAWTEKLLHGFSGHDIPTEYCGYAPSYLTLGANGVLFGAIFGDIDLYFGALFQLTPPADGKGPWAYITIWDFNESGPDINPNGVVQGADGALYGTLNGGDSDGGSVFQLQLPSQAPWPPSDFCY
ncbi:MAG: choice-of-anchor tandem repeat GloVer-containing protein [Terriglobales bacterium]|jgi:hypothetical protein